MRFEAFRGFLQRASQYLVAVAKEIIDGSPHTWVGWLNFLVLQWFFWRLASVEDTDTGKRVGWSWVGPVVPITGWWTNYVFLKRAQRQGT